MTSLFVFPGGFAAPSDDNDLPDGVPGQFLTIAPDGTPIFSTISASNITTNTGSNVQSQLTLLLNTLVGIQAVIDNLPPPGGDVSSLTSQLSALQNVVDAQNQSISQLQTTIDSLLPDENNDGTPDIIEDQLAQKAQIDSLQDQFDAISDRLSDFEVDSNNDGIPDLLQIQELLQSAIDTTQFNLQAQISSLNDTVDLLIEDADGDGEIDLLQLRDQISQLDTDLNSQITDLGNQITPVVADLDEDGTPDVIQNQQNLNTQIADLGTNIQGQLDDLQTQIEALTTQPTVPPIEIGSAGATAYFVDTNGNFLEPSAENLNDIGQPTSLPTEATSLRIVVPTGDKQIIKLISIFNDAESLNPQVTGGTLRDTQRVGDGPYRFDTYIIPDSDIVTIDIPGYTANAALPSGQSPFKVEFINSHIGQSELNINLTDGSTLSWADGQVNDVGHIIYPLTAIDNIELSTTIQENQVFSLSVNGTTQSVEGIIDDKPNFIVGPGYLTPDEDFLYLGTTLEDPAFNGNTDYQARSYEFRALTSGEASINFPGEFFDKVYYDYVEESSDTIAHEFEVVRNAQPSPYALGDFGGATLEAIDSSDNVVTNPWPWLEGDLTGDGYPERIPNGVQKLRLTYPLPANTSAVNFKTTALGATSTSDISVSQPPFTITGAVVTDLVDSISSNQGGNNYPVYFTGTFVLTPEVGATEIVVEFDNYRRPDIYGSSDWDSQMLFFYL